MLFNSIEFLVFFLPLTVCGFHCLLRFYPRAVVYWLTLMSLFFYAWWEPRYLVLLLASTLVNFFLGLALGASQSKTRTNSLYALGLCWNLGLLAYYKYAAFLITSTSSLLGLELTAPSIILPLAISFFTFQQIAYLSDIHKAKKANGANTAEQSIWQYLLFVTFFPQLIAGPIVHHKEMLPQFAKLKTAYTPNLLAPGITLIVLGLAKKVLLADSLALFANPGFTLAETGQILANSEAWLSISAYTLQIYFDFSGYCDIALGCALLMGIRLPINFMSPYQSRSISEFWRRWHMTLSRFMRDYVYIPLGGNRRGDVRWLGNLLATTAVSGLWHGAGWTFIIWGVFHGLMLITNHLWRRGTKNWHQLNSSRLWEVTCIALTFSCVLLAWVPFRSLDLSATQTFYSSLFTVASGDIQSNYWSLFLESARGDVFELFAQSIGNWALASALIIVSLFIVFALPNSLAIIGQQKWGFAALEKGIDRGWLAVSWSANLPWAIVIGATAWMVFISLQSVSPFLYFQF